MIASCKFVRCPKNQHCIEDQNSIPHCVTCNENCSDREALKEVCAANGVTYRNVCQLKKESCQIGRSIPVAYKGPCKGISSNVANVDFS